jgi:hypothetical protein
LHAGHRSTHCVVLGLLNDDHQRMVLYAAHATVPASRVPMTMKGAKATYSRPDSRPVTMQACARQG